MEFKKSVPKGFFKKITIDDVGYEIHVVHEEDDEDGDHGFEKVILRIDDSVTPAQMTQFNLDKDLVQDRFLEIDENNAILHVEHKGKWLGVLSASLYDKHTEYFLVDLQKLVANGNDKWAIYMGGVRGGWMAKIPSVNFNIAFDKETVEYHDGRVKSFIDCFDPSVDAREAQEKLVAEFNHARHQTCLLKEFLERFSGEIRWKHSAMDKVKMMFEDDLMSVHVRCIGNVSGSDLTKNHGYETCPFRPIRWKEDADGKDLQSVFRWATKQDSLAYLVPRVLFSGYVDGIVDINLSWFIDYEIATHKVSFKITIVQDMKRPHTITVHNEPRYCVDLDKPPVITVE